MAPGDAELLRELLRDISALRTEMAGTRSCFRTWKLTKCVEHSRRLNHLEDSDREQDKAINRAAGRAGAIGGILGGVLALLTIGITFWQLAS